MNHLKSQLQECFPKNYKDFPHCNHRDVPPPVITGGDPPLYCTVHSYLDYIHPRRRIQLSLELQ